MPAAAASIERRQGQAGVDWLPAGRLALLAIAKGVVMAVVLLYALDVGFIKALAVAALSSTITGVFLLFATHLTIMGQRRIRGDLGDVKRKVEADRRATDQLGEATGRLGETTGRLAEHLDDDDEGKDG